MWNRFSPPRSALTSIPCRDCKRPLTVSRTCHEAFLRCEHCRKSFPLQDYIAQMDEALEKFLEAVNCDRV